MNRAPMITFVAAAILAGHHRPSRADDDPMPYGEAEGTATYESRDDFDAARRQAKQAAELAATSEDASALALESADDPIDPRNARIVGVMIDGVRPSTREIELLARVSACWIDGSAYKGPWLRLIPSELLQGSASTPRTDSSGLSAWSFSVPRNTGSGGGTTPLGSESAVRTIRLERWSIVDWHTHGPGAKVPPMGQAWFAFGTSGEPASVHRKIVRHLSDGRPVVIRGDIDPERRFGMDKFFRILIDDDRGPNIAIYELPRMTFAEGGGDLLLMARAIAEADSPEGELAALVASYSSNPQAYWTGCRAALLAELLARSGSPVGVQAREAISAQASGPVRDFAGLVAGHGAGPRPERVAAFRASHPELPNLAAWLDQVLRALETDRDVALIPLAGVFAD